MHVIKIFKDVLDSRYRRMAVGVPTSFHMLSEKDCNSDSSYYVLSRWDLERFFGFHMRNCLEGE